MTTDALSALLRTVRLTGATFYDCVAREPWVVESPPREQILPKILPGADRLIAYHVVTMGRCYANIVGQEPMRLEAGEVVVFTNCDPHVLSSRPGMRGVAFDSSDLPAEQLPFFVDFAKDGEVSTKFVCGYLACDAWPFNPLFDNLPPAIKAGRSGTGDANWLDQFIRFAVLESAQKRAGTESVLAKLSELMFIEVVRRHLEALPPQQAGWLAGLRDPFVGKALSLLHGAPAHAWEIDELARQVGVSRSVLAERFTELVGVPPIHYLAQWRMQIACDRLSRSSANMATIAAEIGYESEASFSRAFKKVVGMPPSEWRRRSG
jgi:AraC-like DNA-binding protein